MEATSRSSSTTGAERPRGGRRALVQGTKGCGLQAALRCGISRPARLPVIPHQPRHSPWRSPGAPGDGEASLRRASRKRRADRGRQRSRRRSGDDHRAPESGCTPDASASFAYQGSANAAIAQPMTTSRRSSPGATQPRHRTLVVDGEVRVVVLELTSARRILERLPRGLRGLPGVENGHARLEGARGIELHAAREVQGCRVVRRHRQLEHRSGYLPSPRRSRWW